MYPVWYDKNHPNLREVGPGLFVGSQFAVSRFPFPLIVDLIAWSRKNPQTYPRKSRILALNIEDAEPIPSRVIEHVLSAVDASADPKGETDKPPDLLIHCAAGLSRSASFAYLLLRRGWRGPPLDHAEAFRRISVSEYPHFPCRETIGSVRQWWAEERQREAAARFQSLPRRGSFEPTSASR